MIIRQRLENLENLKGMSLFWLTLYEEEIYLWLTHYIALVFNSDDNKKAVGWLYNAPASFLHSSLSADLTSVPDSQVVTIKP